VRGPLLRMPETPAPTPPPVLSIVIASVNGYWYIARCLNSLARQRAPERAEIIVVEPLEGCTARRIGAEYPEVTVVSLSERRSVPALRAIGIRKAKADIVVTTQDYCVFDPGWYDRIIEAHGATSHAAIGGAVENGSRDRLVDWAAYICEYGKFMLPFEARFEIDLPGPNVSYRRHLLEQACGDLLDQGAWERALHIRMAERGLGLWLMPSLVVYCAKIFEFRDFLSQRYYFGRSFAAMRAAAAPGRMRLVYSTIALLLPPLYLWRYARYVVGKRRFARELLKASPLLVIFAWAWSVGQFIGYMMGDGGASLRVK
jgi:glycosyltransferase involved in cell wall biosynthesis